MLNLKSHHSLLSSKSRSRIHYWLSKFLILPAIFLCLHYLTDSLPAAWYYTTWILRYSSIFLALMLVSYDSYWRPGNQGQVRLRFVSICIVVAALIYMWHAPRPEGFWPFVYIMAISCSWMVMAFIYARRGFSGWLSVCVLLGIGVVGTVLLQPGLVETISDLSLTGISSESLWWPTLLFVAFYAIDIFCLGLIWWIRLREREKSSAWWSTNAVLVLLKVPHRCWIKTRRQGQSDAWLSWGAALVLLVAVCMVTISLLTEARVNGWLASIAGAPMLVVNDLQQLHVSVVALLLLVLMMFSVTPLDFFIYLWMIFRRATRKIRHDRISAFVSPTLVSTNPINRVGDYVRRRFVSDYRAILGVLLITAGAIWGTRWLLQTFLEGQDSPGIGVIGVIFSIWVLALLSYLSIWFVLNRQQHIVLPFEVRTDQDDSQLPLVANLITHAFVEQMRSLGLLLKLQQVENVNNYSNQLQTLFVTSGHEGEFAAHIESLSNIELPDGATSGAGFFHGFFQTILLTMASTKVTGRVQRRHDGSFEIWIELTRRSGHKVAVDKTIIKETSLEEVSDQRLQEVAKESAIKLVMKLGQGRHLASSPESLRHFLNGLEASHRRHWWQAIAHYRRSIQHEESLRNEFGIGHYHLGAAMIFQGDIEQGYKHLQMADAIGPPLAETQYMLALAQLYRSWSELHKNAAIFEQIISHATAALELRRNFPEANHVLGAAYYQHGKLCERETARSTTAQARGEYRDARTDYLRARRYLHRAVRQYRILLRQLPIDVLVKGTVQTTHERVLRSISIALHQLGDCYRSLGFTAMADSHYEDVNIMHPGNLRNLTDQAMNLCLAYSWQRSEEHLRWNVLNKEYGQWNSNFNFYLGWTLLGGVHDAVTFSGLRFIQPLLPDVKRPRGKGRLNGWTYELMNEGFARIDYAINQRPRFIATWEQRDWLQTFQLLRQKHRGLSVPFCQPEIPKSDLQSEQVAHMAEWLRWRVRNFFAIDAALAQVETRMPWLNVEMNLPEEVKQFIGWGQDDEQGALVQVKIPADASNIEPSMLENVCRMVANSLQLARRWMTTVLWATDRHRYLSSTERKLRGLEIAVFLNKEWQILQNCLALLNSSIAFEVTIQERKLIDLYGDIAIMSIRLFIEAESFDDAERIAEESSETIAVWLETRWESGPWYGVEKGQSDGGDDNAYQFRFSPYVLRFHRATLFAWLAYIRLNKGATDGDGWGVTSGGNGEAAEATLGRWIRTQQVPTMAILSNELNEIEKMVAKGLHIYTNHPLALFVQAQIYVRRKLHSRAIDQFHELLNAIAPFDPKTHTANWEIGRRSQKSTRAKDSRISAREYLYFMERVCGERQFEDFIDRAHVHMALAQQYMVNELTELAIEHTQLAIAWSSYHDLDLKNFKLLATRLSELELFPEAYDAIQEAMDYEGGALFETNAPNSFITRMKRVEAYILACVINSRLGRYPVSLQAGLEILNTVFRRIPATGDSVQPIGEMAKDAAAGQNLGTMENIAARVLAFRPLEEVIDMLDGQSMPPADLGTDYAALVADRYLNTLQECQREIVDLEEGIASIEEVPSATKPAANTQQEGHEPGNSQDRLAQQKRLFKCRKAFEEAVRYIVHLCDLLNNVAYNLTELNISLIRGRNMDPYRVFADECSDVAIALMKRLLNDMPNNHTYYEQNRSRLAQYYDTKGWIVYRIATEYGEDEGASIAHNNQQHSSTAHSSDIANSSSSATTDEHKDGSSVPDPKANHVALGKLHDAIMLFREALSYEQGSAIIHYHITRVELTRIELTWQQEPWEVRELINGEPAKEISLYLRSASNHWHIAQRLDLGRRLYAKLNTSRKRLNEYMGSWHKMQGVEIMIGNRLQP